jgi:c-di-GMP-binding flagellar brake protein YcgR
MREKRKKERIKEFNEITITVISDGENLPEGKNMHNYSEDISVSGSKIRSNIVLPVDTLLKIDFTLKNLQQQITAVGKIKWVQVIIEDEYYQAGVEFVDTPNEAIQKIEDYVSWKKKRTSHNPFGIPL